DGVGGVVGLGGLVDDAEYTPEAVDQVVVDLVPVQVAQQVVAALAQVLVVVLVERPDVALRRVEEDADGLVEGVIGHAANGVEDAIAAGGARPGGGRGGGGPRGGLLGACGPPRPPTRRRPRALSRPRAGLRPPAGARGGRRAAALAAGGGAGARESA